MPDHNPIALLAAALQTERPQLLEVFKGQVLASLDAGEPVDPELVRSLVTAIENLFGEVYDLRRTSRAVMEANKHVFQGLSGLRRHLDAAREVTERGLAGNLPDHHDAPSILAEIKADLVAERRGLDEDEG